MPDVVRVVNVIPNSHSNETNQDSEPSIAVNPANPSEIVITAFTPPDSGQTGGPIYWSTDNGDTWNLNFDVPGGGSADQSVAFATGGNQLYGATLRGDTLAMNVFRTTAPTTAGVLTAFDVKSNIDQPWVEARTVPSGNDAGKDRVYLGYNDDGVSSGKSASIEISADGTVSGTPSFNLVRLEQRSIGSGLRDGYAIRPVAHADGTVYTVHERWTAGSFGADITTDIVVSRDDNWGTGGSPFTDLQDPGDHKAGRIVASGVVIDDGGNIGQERLNNDLAIAVDPTDSSVVYVAWSDNAGPNYTVRVRRSTNRGVDWSGDLLTADNATMVCLAINSAGVVGLMYQQVVGSNWETHFRRTTDGTGTAWSDVVLNRSDSTTPSPQFQPYLGDWARVVSVGRSFSGVFCANNTPDPTNFPQGVSYLRNRTTNAPFRLLGSDNSTTVGASIDPFFFQVTEVDAEIITDRSTFGQDEVAAMIHQSGVPAVIPGAFYVVVDGFRAEDLGITAATLSGIPNVAPAFAPTPALSEMTIHAVACTASDPSALGVSQRFTWTYDAHFTGTDDFTMENRTVEIAASITSTGGVTVSAEALITLTKQPNPFEVDGPTSWLSVDLQVFTLLPGLSLPHTPGIQMSHDPHDFLRRLLDDTPGSGGWNDPDLPRFPNHPYDQDLVPTGNTRSIELAAGLPFGFDFFNFAIARVRYRAHSAPAHKVRVFFRSFQAATTSVDFQPTTTYLTGGQSGTKIPVLGVVNGEVVTVPFFAEPRIADPTTHSMNEQSDPLNVQTIPPDASGAEVERYFGCWLDINRTDHVLPITTSTPSGPFPASDLKSIQQAFIRSPHQCLVAEINFDQQPIATGVTPTSSDKLAQRNLSLIGASSPHQIPQPFDVRALATAAAERVRPDELLIDFGDLPRGGTASIFLPGTTADAVLARADGLYGRHRLHRVDDHTIGLPAEGLAFFPLVGAADANLAGLLTVDLPSTVVHGQELHVVTHQLTNAVGQGKPPPPPPPPEPRARGAKRAVEDRASITDLFLYRRVVGSFQVTIPVAAKTAFLDREARNLGVMRYIFDALPATNRWHPVLERYLRLLTRRVHDLGGNPDLSLPSPWGVGHPPEPGPHPGAGGELERTGKVAGLIFDGFGDFEGFVLDTIHDDHTYASRERDLADLVELAWRERLRVRVISSRHQPERAVAVILLEPPARV